MITLRLILFFFSIFHLSISLKSQIDDDLSYLELLPDNQAQSIAERLGVQTGKPIDDTINMETIDQPKFDSLKEKNLSESFYNLGILYQKINNFNLSIEFFERAIHKDNQNYQFFNSIGISYQRIFNYAKAELAYKNAINLNNKSDKAYSNLGLLKQKSGFYEEAIYYYNLALKLKPNNAGILFNKSLCYLENRNFKAMVSNV